PTLDRSHRTKNHRPVNDAMTEAGRRARWGARSTCTRGTSRNAHAPTRTIAASTGPRRRTPTAPSSSNTPMTWAEATTSPITARSSTSPRPGATARAMRTAVSTTTTISVTSTAAGTTASVHTGVFLDREDGEAVAEVGGDEAVGHAGARHRADG